MTTLIYLFIYFFGEICVTTQRSVDYSIKKFARSFFILATNQQVYYGARQNLMTNIKKNHLRISLKKSPSYLTLN